VAATSFFDSRASYSNSGSHCDVAAPGGELEILHDDFGIYSTLPTYPCYLTLQYSFYEDYDFLQGTSCATAQVSGLAALIWGVNPALSPNEVISIITSTALDLGAPGKDPDFGYGRIDASAALRATPHPAPRQSLFWAAK
jgi:subtilisin family serine protease